MRRIFTQKPTSQSYSISPDYKVMSGPPIGNYSIRLASDDKAWIGIDDGGPPVWTVKRSEDGKYALEYLRAGNNVYIIPDEYNVVGSIVPSSYPWIISGPDGGPYTIETSGLRPHQAWTVKDTSPEAFVTLEYLEKPLPEQQFCFVPWPGPE
ncbi:hypothetical protein L210DRAFT_3641313 [Boletus edulis BED1]|uniref:Uncharacterized protein n=1 Tax=Boletus edulis BED1 TaxID=1328754 RepID=A0AAD4GK49_BOLED|nr:hypothetical protein L210DRAFT_3641313 [Boletus edulis BED1]